MTKDEMKNRISMALKDPILQQGFEIICKNLAELEKENAQAKEILRLFLDANDNLEMVNAQMKAEQFLKDSEVEK